MKPLEVQPENNQQRKIIKTVVHPKYGLTITFIDENGLGMQIGEGDDTFIVRPVARGLVAVETTTEVAKQTAAQLMGEVIDQRGGHN